MLGGIFFRNKRRIDSEITSIKHAAENDLNIRRKGNEEPDKESNSPRVSFERLPSNQNTQTLGEINCNDPYKDNEENGNETIFEDYTFAEEHIESMTELKQKILNKLAVVRHANMHD
ncbi:Hypothetical predicted protein [Octopus vulgaris]|uniref:Uncharacterized protein n=1 Tax=Octopus vulgaris TaxID=6645 RepID=A0AA36BJM1_OCTVU|nr:Hypothetical predicted protein [Octopus vulgaris]